jgi:hypothetical protein
VGLRDPCTGRNRTNRRQDHVNEQRVRSDSTGGVGPLSSSGQAVL